MTRTTIIKLEDLEPSLRFDVEKAAKARGGSQWAVIDDGSLDLAETLGRLDARIDDIEERAERMNETIREEMRSSASDHGRPDEKLLTAASLLARIKGELEKLR